MAGKPSTAARATSVREELQRVFESTASTDEFVHGLMAFIVELSRAQPNHPMLRGLSEELGRASAAPLVAAAMHDLRSILQGVSAGLDYAPVLLRRSGALERSPDNRRLDLLLEAIDDARHGTKMAAELAGETLQAQRETMVGAEPGEDRVVLNEVVRGAGRLGGRLAPLTLQLETGDQVEVRAKRSAMMRVLINLLRNAAHAIDELEEPAGAGVTLSSWASDEFAFVQVSDDGPGIPAAAAAGIFDLFFTTHDEGTGVGLYICKTLVTEWGGMIHVDSRDGEGARFTFSVPLLDSHARA